MDGDVTGIITWGKPRQRRRVFEALTPENSCINMDVTWNDRIGPNNNTSVMLYTGFQQDAIIKKG